MLLAKHATELKAAGLRRITVSLDSLDPEVFARLSGGFGGVEQVLEGIEAARRAGLAPIKVNAVVQRGVNDHTVFGLLEPGGAKAAGTGAGAPGSPKTALSSRQVPTRALVIGAPVAGGSV